MQNISQAPNVTNINQSATFTFLSPEHISKINTPLSSEEIQNLSSSVPSLTSQMC